MLKLAADSTVQREVLQGVQLSEPQRAIKKFDGVPKDWLESSTQAVL